MQSVRVPRAPLVMAGVLVCLLLLAHSNLRAQDAVLAASAVTPDAPALTAPANGALTTGMTHPPLGVPTFAWQTVANATKYQLQISVADGFATTVVNVETENTNYTPIIALGSGIFYWRVRAAAGSTWGPYSQVWDFTVDWSAAGTLAPQLTAPADGAERAAFNHEDFTWTPVPGAATYSFKIARDPDMASIAYSAVTVAPHHTPLQRLDNNLYYWQVTPIDNRGHAGAASEKRTFTFAWNTAPQLLAPASLAELPFVPRFSWTAVEAAKEYRLQISTQENFVVYEQIVTRNTDHTPVNALANDQDYFWRVQAVDMRGITSPWSEIRRFRTKWNFKPELLSPANNSIHLAFPFFSWAPVPGAESYQIQIASNNSFNPKIDDKTIFNVTNYTQPRWSTALLDTAYYWRVRVLDAQGNLTPWSETWSFQFSATTVPNLVYPLPYYVPDTVNTPVHGDRSAGWPLFVWDTAHPNGAPTTSYTLEVDDDPAFGSPNFTIHTGGIAAAPTLDNPFIDLQDGALYYWRVCAAADCQPVTFNVTWLTRFSASAQQTPPVASAAPIYPADGFEAVHQPPVLGWQPVTGAAGYRVQIARDAQFTDIVDEAQPQFVNYVPWQRHLDTMPFGTYWWRVRAENASGNALGGWSAARHFNLSVELTIGNYYDYPAPLNLTTDPSGRTRVATSASGATDKYALHDLYVLAERRQTQNYNQFWVVAFTTGAAVGDAMQYAVYFDADHVANSGGAVDPLGNSAITVDSLYRPEYVVYVDKPAGGSVSAYFFAWDATNNLWGPLQNLTSLGGSVEYDEAQQSVQILIPYTALGSADDHWVGSLALAVLSVDPVANVIRDAVPEQGAVLDNPVFVSNALLPLYPFDTPFADPLTYYDMPPLRWRMPPYSTDGYQVQIARDAQFTDLVETWESYEERQSSFYTLIPTAAQSLNAYANNESYYWRVRQRHEEYDPDRSDFDYGPWSPAMRFKLGSRRVGNPQLSTGAEVYMTPTFLWDRVEGAAGYTIQIDDDSNFSSPLITQATDATSFTPTDSGAALQPGVQYYWRVVMRRNDAIIGHWTDPMNFTKTSVAPVTLAPVIAASLTSTEELHQQPTLRWRAVLTPTQDPRLAAPQYRLQIANTADFASPEVAVTTQATSYMPAKGDALPDGQWFWRVALLDANGKPGPYSATDSFTKQYLPPAIVTTRSINPDGSPMLAWTPVDGAAYYKVEYANDVNYNGSTAVTTDLTHYVPTKSLAYSTYYWRVQIYDADRNPGPVASDSFFYYLPASFLYAPGTGIAPATIAFTDTTPGTVQSWRWSFGDGGTSTLRNPTHLYAVGGAYTVTMQNVNIDGYTRTVTATNAIRIYQRVSARFTAVPLTGAIPLTVKFNDQSTGDISRWLWNFGDGSTSVEISPTHVYTQPGYYQVVLSVSGQGGADTVVRQNYIFATTPTPSPTPSSMPTPSVTPTATNTPTPTDTNTPTPTATNTSTPKPTDTPTPTPTNTPTATPTNTPTATPIDTATPPPNPTTTSTATMTPNGPPPQVTGVEPDNDDGQMEISVTIRGEAFAPVPYVYFGRHLASEVTFVSSSQIEAVKPTGAEIGVLDVRVCNPDGQCHVLPAAFTVTANVPSYESYLPAVQR